MEAFNKFSSASFPEIRKASELIEGEGYLIMDMRQVNTKFGNTLVADLRENEQKKVFSIFLPQRFLNALDGQDLKQFCNGKYELVFTEVKKNKSPKIVMKKALRIRVDKK